MDEAALRATIRELGKRKAGLVIVPGRLLEARGFDLGDVERWAIAHRGRLRSTRLNTTEWDGTMYGASSSGRPEINIRLVIPETALND